MHNQNRIYRIFQLVNALKSKPPKSLTALTKHLETSERTVYRYLDLLKELGFKIERGKGPTFWITSSTNTEILPFTPQESDYVEKLIRSSGKQNKIADSVLMKVNNSRELHVGSNSMLKAHLGHIVEQISIAIIENKQLLIRNYTSANSQTISDRVVEPMCFTDNYESVSAFEVKTKQNKYFNIERMGSVEVLDKPMKYENLHEFYKPDVFGFQGKTMDKEIELELSLRSYLVLKEEFPMSIPYIEQIQSSDRYRLKVQVQSFLAPGRFVLGFREDIEVIGSPPFLKYLQTKMKKGG